MKIIYKEFIPSESPRRGLVASEYLFKGVYPKSFKYHGSIVIALYAVHKEHHHENSHTNDPIGKIICNYMPHEKLIKTCVNKIPLDVFTKHLLENDWTTQCMRKYRR